MGKTDQIGEIYIISGMLKLFPHYVWAFHLTQSNLFEFVERRYFEHFGRTSKSARYAAWLSFRVRKVIVHILN